MSRLKIYNRTSFSFLYSSSLYSPLSKFEPGHDKTNKMTFARSENSDQPGHPPSLIRVFAVRMKKAIRRAHSKDFGQTAETSLGARVMLLVLSCSGSYVYFSFRCHSASLVWQILICGQ